MNLSISNIAWDRNEDAEVASLLDSHDVRCIDVAPGKYFPDIPGATASEIRDVRAWWADRGVSIIGMQSLLFGTTGLNLFGDHDSRKRMLIQLGHVFRIAEGLGATRLVFGSPKNRDRHTLTSEQAHPLAVEFFRRAGDLARDHGVMLCLEPNPPCYGSNYMTTSAETADVVGRVDHPNVKMQWDTGACFINDEDPDDLVRRLAPIIGHIHISEPGLVPIGQAGTDHRRMSSQLRTFLDPHVFTIEMLRPAAGVGGIDKALRFTRNLYVSGEGACVR